MTTKERLILMDDIKRKNDAAWSKYSHQSSPYWAWTADVKKPFNPFDSIGGKILIAVCVPALMVLFVLMAR